MAGWTCFLGLCSHNAPRAGKQTRHVQRGWGPAAGNQGLAGPALPRDLREGPPRLSQSLGSRQPRACGCTPSSRVLPGGSVSQFVPLLRTPVIGYRAHPEPL